MKNKIKSVIFPAPMIRAILENRKTEMRLPVVKWKPKYKPEDILRVKEGWQEFFIDELPSDRRVSPNGKFGIPSEPDRKSVVVYRADGPLVHPTQGPANWISAVKMPIYASRIWLEILDLRVERLWKISEDGAKAEGFEPIDLKGIAKEQTFAGEGLGKHTLGSSPCRFAMWFAWDDKYLEKPFRWYDNPLVNVYKFRRCTRPQDV